MENDSNITSEKLLYLLACALNKSTPDRIFKRLPGADQSSSDVKTVSDSDFNRLVKLAHKHSVLAMAAASLLKGASNDYMLSHDQLKKLHSIQGTAMRRRMLFDTERRVIIKFLEENGIWYCPLKGIIMQDLYPAYEYREMADNDILYDASKREAVLKFMTDRGYHLEDTEVNHHDEYIKEPMYNFELHNKLFRSIASETLSEYYDKIKAKLISDGNSRYGLKFTNEDFYIYITAHSFKHYEHGEAGFKVLTDTFVYNRTYGSSLNREYIDREMTTLGILDFEKMCHTLSDKFFADPDKTYSNISNLPENERKFLDFMIRTGTFGSKEDHIRGQLKKLTGGDENITKKAKMKYYKSRLFPDDNYYKEAHPTVYKHKSLKPFFIAYRLVSKGLLQGKKITKEINTLENLDKNEKDDHE